MALLKKRKDPNTGLVSRTHPDEPDIKSSKEERIYWKILEIIPDTKAYTAYDKLDVLMAFASTGSFHEVAKLVPKVPIATARTWREMDWWKPALEKVREMMDEEFDGRVTKVLNLSLDAMEERLANGEEVVLKDGSIVRKKIGFKDLSIGGVAVPYDKRALNRGEPTQRIEQTSDASRLEKLKQQFKEIAQTRIINITPETSFSTEKQRENKDA